MQTQIHKDSWMISLGVAQVPEHLYKQRDIGQSLSGRGVYLSSDAKQSILKEIENRISDNPLQSAPDLFNDLLDDEILPETFSFATFRNLYADANKVYRRKNGVRFKYEIVLDLWDKGIRDISTIAQVAKASIKLVYVELNRHGRRVPTPKGSRKNGQS